MGAGSDALNKKIGTAPFWLAVFVVLLAVGCGDSEKPIGPQAHPNVVLITLDPARPERLSSQGNSTSISPALQRLASQGSSFENAFAQSPGLLPSFVTLMTSLPPEQHKVTTHDLGLREEALTIAEVLRDSGFVTAAFASDPVLSKSRGLDQGFDHYRDSSDKNALRASEQSVTNATAWLKSSDANARGKAFFLYVNVSAGTITTTNVEQAREQHDKNLEAMDKMLAPLFGQLESPALQDNTLVIVTSNHGFALGEHQPVLKAGSVYDEVLRVPLIMRLPSILDSGKRVHLPARTMDIGPTILMLTRIRLPPEFGFPHPAYGFEMRDLTELLIGIPPDKHIVVAGESVGVGRFMRLGEYKIVQQLDREGEAALEFYNVAIDPGEQESLMEGEHMRAAGYKKKLEAWRAICSSRPSYEQPHGSPQ